MANTNLPQGHTLGHTGAGNASSAQNADQSRLERVLTKGSLWKKQTLHNIEGTQKVEQGEASGYDQDTERLVRMFVKLSHQLDERNHEIERLRTAISSLENEKSELGKVRQRELESHRNELEHLQNAYDQFEKESDSLISELGEQNDRLLNACRYQNDRSLL